MGDPLIIDGVKAEIRFPDDLNGDVLRRMHDGGDDLSQPRVIDFSFVFSDRRGALSFAQMVDDPEKEVCISFYEPKQSWQVAVKYRMVPNHQDITALESELSAKAESVGGKADGWGCFRIPRKQTT
jgi:hypothetical protein